MRKRLKRYAITSGIDEHPAVLAWMTFAGGEPAKAVFVLKERIRASHKSAVYRLKGCGPDGKDVVAKHTWVRTSSTTPEALSAVYALLGRASDPVAPCLLGTLVGPDTVWMFFENVEGLPFDGQDREHRRGAARLAARMHSLEPTDAELAVLPRRDAPYYKQRLLDAANRLQAFQIGTGTVCPPVVGRVRTRLETVLDTWDSLDECIRNHPARLVHGDLSAKNLVVRGSETNTQVVAVDWETVGFGCRFVDLQCVDIPEYRSASGLAAEGDANDAVAAVLRVGSILRLIDCVAWTVLSLKGSNIDRPVRHLEAYDAAFANHLPLGLGAA